MIHTLAQAGLEWFTHITCQIELKEPKKQMQRMISSIGIDTHLGRLIITQVVKEFTATWMRTELPGITINGLQAVSNNTKTNEMQQCTKSTELTQRGSKHVNDLST